MHADALEHPSSREGGFTVSRLVAIYITRAASFFSTQTCTSIHSFLNPPSFFDIHSFRSCRLFFFAPRKQHSFISILSDSLGFVFASNHLEKCSNRHLLRWSCCCAARLSPFPFPFPPPRLSYQPSQLWAQVNRSGSTTVISTTTAWA